MTKKINRLLQILFLSFVITILLGVEFFFKGNTLAILFSFIIILLYALRYMQKDLFHPLSFILFVAIIRFYVHGFVVLNHVGIEPSLYDFFRITSENWHQGLILASIGLLSLILGWKLKKTSKKNKKSRISYSRLKYIGYIGLAIGSTSWALFIVLNGMGISEAATSGLVRSMDVTSGTGRFFYLALLLIPSTILLSILYVQKGQVKLAWILTFYTFFLLFVLGGRTRAISIILALLFILWYEKYYKTNKKINISISLKKIILIIFAFMSFVVIFALTGVYRGGQGLEAIAEHMSTFSFYVDFLAYSIYIDIGQLHALAGIAQIGGNSIPIESSSFSVLLYPFNRIFSINDTNVGVYILRGLTSWDDWALHPTLIGDSYANFGFFGIVIINIIFGYLLHSIYLINFYNNLFYRLLYIITFIYMLRIYNESIQKYQEWFTVISYFLFMVFIYYLTLKKKNSFKGASFENS